ncbi:hypothetical protein MPTK1_2g08280 [Marchantia polymorpha subsp. ruderalis]|uniref:Uncharacterized protein n=1 Tax=Marchantia polymorpha TaxID=3197 RepID=A0A2R6XGS3_MARPO|nr:hypothetical protein MARPO_0015s0113 [Marchantia polymorpha]BBN01549.1 hypothetical protein Mp_2g08280 [Marchantia polymorpha subsp. ruderalis]|eukprot:PTQ45315.1 hypothetical protein MARPO_0015s0113 [Marchantia polymorpha]
MGRADAGRAGLGVGLAFSPSTAPQGAQNDVRAMVREPTKRRTLTSLSLLALLLISSSPSEGQDWAVRPLLSLGAAKERGKPRPRGGPTLKVSPSSTQRNHACRLPLLLLLAASVRAARPFLGRLATNGRPRRRRPPNCVHAAFLDGPCATPDVGRAATTSSGGYPHPPPPSSPWAFFGPLERGNIVMGRVLRAL